jgi:hypothetical protein
VPYAALCRVAQFVRHVRCPFAVEPPVELVMHGAAQGMPYAAVLINRARPERSISTSAEVTAGRLGVRAVTSTHMCGFQLWAWAMEPGVSRINTPSWS